MGENMRCSYVAYFAPNLHMSKSISKKSTNNTQTARDWKRLEESGREFTYAGLSGINAKDNIAWALWLTRFDADPSMRKRVFEKTYRKSLLFITMSNESAALDYFLCFVFLCNAFQYEHSFFRHKNDNNNECSGRIAIIAHTHRADRLLNGCVRASERTLVNWQ